MPIIERSETPPEGRAPFSAPAGRRRRLSRTASALLLAAPTATALLAGESGARELRPSTPRAVQALPREAYEPHLGDDRVEWETWDYVFWFPNGYWLLAQFQVTNAGPRKHHGLVTGVIVLPNSTNRLLRNSRPRDKWRVELGADEVRLTLHTHRFVIGPRRHHVQLRNRMGAFDLEAESVTPAVVLGPVANAREDAYELTLLAPRLRASGVLQLPGVPPVELRNGWGMAAHARSTLPNHQQTRSAFSFHAFDQGVQLSLFALAVPRGSEQESFGWLLLSREGRTVEVVPTFERLWTDAIRESEKPRYLTPRRLVVRSGEGIALEAHLGARPVARFDILGWIQNPILRFFAGRSSHPVQYLFDARYGLRLGARSHEPQASALGPTVSGNGLLNLSILNQPRPEWP